LYFRSDAFGHGQRKTINIRVDADLKKQAKKLAENDGRSLSNWILQLIRNEIEMARQNTKK
jgi:predicted HicB family RNase H-like nuclease